MSMFEDKEKKMPFDNVKPTYAFVAGLVGGVLILCTIGFFVLLVVMFKGNVSPGALKNRAAGDRVATAPTPAPAPTAPAPQAAGQVPPVTSSDHVRGSANAAITLVEYSDYECPFCKSFHPTMQRLMTEYNGKVKWVYRHFPLSFHQNAEKEAEAAECVAELAGNDAFWKFTDKIFEQTTSNGTGFALTSLPALAEEVGAPQKKFEDCLNSGKYTTYVQDQMAGGSAAGVDGTPGTIVLNDQGQTRLVAGAVPYEQLKAAVDALQ